MRLGGRWRWRTIDLEAEAVGNTYIHICIYYKYVNVVFNIQHYIMGVLLAGASWELGGSRILYFMPSPGLCQCMHASSACSGLSSAYTLLSPPPGLPQPCTTKSCCSLAPAAWESHTQLSILEGPPGSIFYLHPGGIFYLHTSPHRHASHGHHISSRM